MGASLPLSALPHAFVPATPRASTSQAAEQGRGVATYGNGAKLLMGAAQKMEGAIKVHACARA